MNKLSRKMSNIGRATTIIPLRIDEEDSFISKGYFKEAEVNEMAKIESLVDRRKKAQTYKRTFKQTIMYIFRAQAIYVLLPSVPIALIFGFLKMSPGLVFAANCFAIIPLAAMLSFATEELAVPAGEAIGGLLNATFGNAVEIIVSVFALWRGEIRIVQASMLGSILSNLLLVLGCCFVWGGSHHKEQDFDGTLATTMSSLLAVSSASLILPAVLYMTLPSGDGKTSAFPMILSLSRYSSIILLPLYCLFLFFTLWTHHGYFEKKMRKVVKIRNRTVADDVVETFPVEDEEVPEGEEDKEEHWEEIWVTAEQAAIYRKIGHYADEEGAAEAGLGGSNETTGLLANTTANGRSYNGNNGNNGNSRNSRKSAKGNMYKMKIPARHLTIVQSLIMLALTTAVVSQCADFLVDAIDPFVSSTPWLTKTFIGLIIIPIVGNAAEHFTAVIAAGKNKMDLAVGVAVGSSLQIALGVTPLLVLIGWAMHQPMSLYFQPFETVVLFISVLIAHYLIQDGKSNYLEGAMLIGTYAIICVCFFVIPDDLGGKVGVMFTNMISW